jgi:folate-binding protein YgfZ
MGSLLGQSRLRNTAEASKQDRQMAHKTVPLTDRGLISVQGADAQKFLQDLVTADVDRLSKGEACFGALLTPQGKILFDFFMIREEGGFLIDCLKEMREDLIKRLNFYRLRAKLTISADERGVGAVLGGKVEGAIADPRPGGMGQRTYGAQTGRNGPLADYHRRRIGEGLAEAGHDFNSGELFPHEANFDKIGAVSFEKGCFVGQEVVSRMEHRGTARSRIVPCRVEGKLPARNAPVEVNQKAIGKVCSGMEDQLLALLRLDRLEEAAAENLTVTAAGSRLFPRKPTWADYTVPAFG